MKTASIWIPFVNMGLNLVILAIVPYLFKHEKCHTKIELLLEQICSKLDIKTGR